MKIITLIAAVLSLAAVSAYANHEGKAHDGAKAEARKACKEEGKKGKDLKACVKEKLEKK
jgi:hypothetical protein